ncbi:SOS response-associated peptidase [Kribbella sp. NBC_00359]|uniref:SOS response-associated peptidase n=1 Tax=Kribbella sp. NBC_00359 TaxID=2975966 RepID=UPI002E22FC83
MCGRYASVASRAELLERFVVDESNAGELRGQDFNVTPTKDNPVVIARVPQDADEDAEPVRELRAFRWGLLPFWAKDIKVGAKMINARAETVHEKPAYRRAFKSQRALIPVDAFYEWLETDQVGKSGKKLKQPFALRPADGSTLALAGLYEVWYDKSLPDDDPARVVPTYTIITATATDSVGRIHDRTPMAITGSLGRVARSPQPRRRPAAWSHGAAGRRQPRHVRCLEGRQQCEEQRPRLVRATAHGSLTGSDPHFRSSMGTGLWP